MVIPLRSALGLSSIAALAVLPACAPDAATAPSAGRPVIPALAHADAQAALPASLPSGERMLGQSLIEPAYGDVVGNLVYLATPLRSPFPTHTSSHAVAPLYLVEYPPGSTVGTMNCMGVPGNCPDHDGEVAGAATSIMPSVYGTNPAAVPGHNHLVAPPAGGGDFNVAWEVVEVLFTNKAAANTLLTTEAEIDAAVARGDAIEVDLGFAFHCSVVSPAAYFRGTPVG
jgi:hypothetical protein